MRLSVDSSLIHDRVDLIDSGIEDEFALRYFDCVVRHSAGELDPVGKVGHAWSNVIGVAVIDEPGYGCFHVGRADSAGGVLGAAPSATR